MVEPQVLVRSVNPDDWEDVVDLFGTKGDPAGCWCQWFRFRNADWKGRSTPDNRDALHQEVVSGQGPPPGVLAWLDGEPVGWCAVGPRPGYQRLASSSKVKAGNDDLGDPGRWAVLCFVVRVGHRRQGLSTALLDGAVDLARQHGAISVDAYPVDTAAKGKISAADLYHGALSTFLAAGFTEITRTAPSRPIVRLSLTG